MNPNLKKFSKFSGVPAKFCTHGYLFLHKLPLNMGMGPELPVAQPDQSKSEKPQGYPQRFMIKMCLLSVPNTFLHGLQNVIYLRREVIKPRLFLT